MPFCLIKNFHKNITGSQGLEQKVRAQATSGILPVSEIQNTTHLQNKKLTAE